MGLTNILIEKYKNRKKKAFLDQPLFHTRKKYAFIGVGMHSMTNLYPVLNYFNISLKYIFTDSSSSAEQFASVFAGAAATHSISDILNDKEVAGVFVCGPPQKHFQIASRVLESGKHLFIEKPPCYSSAQLLELSKLALNLNCFVNLQKRFGTANIIATPRIKNVSHYHCKYLVGKYPEGNPIYDLFIHPIDNCVQLFGKAEMVYVKRISSAEFLIVLQHANTTGILELSAKHSWVDPQDLIVINTADEIITICYPNLVESQLKEKSILEIPLEKIIRGGKVKNTYFNNNGAVPSLENSSHVVHGFYGALENFIVAVEKNEVNKDYNINTVHNTYEILDALNEKNNNPGVNV